MKIAGVVVLYEPNEKVFSNIHSYLPNLEKLFVVDNTPNHSSEKMFKDKKIEYIWNRDNLGIAKALNIGARKAITEGFEWLLTMDQDSKFNNNFSEMVYFLESFKNNAEVSKILGYSYDKIGLISPLHNTITNQDAKTVGVSNQIVVMTSGNIINLNAYTQIGGFKDWLFIDCVDFDYCLNLQNHGYEIIQLNYVKMEHSLGDMQQKHFLWKHPIVTNHNYIRRYYMVRNRHYINDLYKSSFPNYCKEELSQTKKELVKIWLYENDKIRKTISMFKGYIDYKKGIKGNYKK